MRLARALAHLKQQHWTGVLIELLIVVLGVFLGLQAQDWNQARQDRAREHQYLQRIYADVQSTLNSHGPLSRFGQWDRERLANQALVLKDLNAGVLPEKDRQKFNNGLFYFGYTNSVEVRWSTVDEMKSTGSMNVIRDTRLRDLLGRNDAELRHNVYLSNIAADLVNGYRLQIGSKFAVSHTNDDFADAKGLEVTYDFHALASDPAFINILTHIDIASRAKVAYDKREMDSLRALRDDLAKRLHVVKRVSP